MGHVDLEVNLTSNLPAVPGGASLAGMMKAGWGRIVNISSVWGRRAPGQANYALPRGDDRECRKALPMRSQAGGSP